MNRHHVDLGPHGMTCRQMVANEDHELSIACAEASVAVYAAGYEVPAWLWNTAVAA